MGWGLSTFLSRSKHALGSHEYIQHCRKFDIDIRLQLMRRKGVRSDLARTVGAGDACDSVVPVGPFQLRILWFCRALCSALGPPE